MKKLFTCLLGFAIIFTSCTTNKITGRSQLALVPESALQQEAVLQYQTFLSQNKVVPSTKSDAEMVKRVGSRIANAITKYYSEKGISDQLAGYKWEFNLVESPEVNAWCMPGGKVVVYTGILPITQTDAGLAIVLGHEIAHAVLQHGRERMSEALLAQGLQVGGDIFTKNNPQVNNIFNAVYVPGAQIGVLLPNSRKQELEADHYGLIFAAMAGYDPEVAIPLWERMSKLNKGNQVPEFLSDHPVDSKRIRKLKQEMPEALKYYHGKK